MTEFNLSEKMAQAWTNPTKPLQKVFYEKDVKEFIKRLKDEIDDFVSPFYNSLIKEKIDELAGDKLI